MSAYMRLVPPTNMHSLHKGGWRVSVSLTLVESDSMNRVVLEDQKAITIPHCGFA